MSSAALWALWIVAGGSAHSGHFDSPAPQAYFRTEAECTRVLNLLAKLPYARTMQCIQAQYVQPPAGTP